jgi:hypothetical protein
MEEHRLKPVLPKEFFPHVAVLFYVGPVQAFAGNQPHVKFEEER